MIFNQGYYNAMDRGYYMPIAPGEGQPGDDPTEVPDIGLSQKDIGISAPPMQDQLQQLKAKIFQGASKVELGFTGRGKGSMGGSQTTPEMYGTEERVDIRELARANQVTLTTHASPQAGSLAGLGQQGFDEHAREMALHEVERAVDFAADTTEGGAVVVHANEFPRPILDSYPDFEAYPEENERAVYHLVDTRTGQMTPIRKNTVVYEPVYETNEKGDWIDMHGNVISKTENDYRKLFNRVPKWKPEGTEFEVHPLTWDEIQERSKNWNQAHPNDQKTPEEIYFQIQVQNNILQAKGASLFYGLRYEMYTKERKKLKEALDYYTELKKRLPPEEHWKLKQETGRSYFVPADVEDPEEYLQRQLKQIEDELRMTHEHSGSYDVQAENAAENLKYTTTIKNYALDKSADTIARSAIYAMERAKKITPARTGEPYDVYAPLSAKSGKTGKPPEKDLYIAVENFFPEQYGGHPGEIREMVLRARDAMEEKLASRYGREKAHDLAERHIKATWDTGHANIWRKYFKEKPGETIEQADERFKKWYLEEARKWRDNGVIGHVHVSDNFGWEDEHVTPGQGNTPIKEFIQEIKKDVDSGKVDVIVEPAHQDYRAMLGGWKMFGSSVYGLSMGRRDSWMDVERSYFGRNAPPYFLYGASAPDHNEWTLWSGQPME